MDPRARFSSTVEDYRRHRPDYPDALFDWLLTDLGLRPGACVLDVGSGTGIASRQLASRGMHVVGVEPNAAMRAAAEAEPPPLGHGSVRYLGSDAERLDVDVERVDGIVGAQSFHWFDLDRAVPRFRELLREGGRIAAFWNLRDDADPFMGAYERVLLDWCPDYAREGAEPRAEAVARHPQLRGVSTQRFDHGQSLDLEGFRGRVWSSSYVRHGIDARDRAAFERDLDRLFASHAQSGTVRFVYRTFVVSFC